MRKEIGIEELYSNFHIIAMEYNWDRETIRNLTRTERERWAEFIITDLDNRWGGE